MAQSTHNSPQLSTSDSQKDFGSQLGAYVFCHMGARPDFATNMGTHSWYRGLRTFTLTVLKNFTPNNTLCARIRFEGRFEFIRVLTLTFTLEILEAAAWKAITLKSTECCKLQSDFGLHMLHGIIPHASSTSRFGFGSPKSCHFVDWPVAKLKRMMASYPLSLRAGCLRLGCWPYVRKGL